MAGGEPPVAPSWWLHGAATGIARPERAPSGLVASLVVHRRLLLTSAAVVLALLVLVGPAPAGAAGPGTGAVPHQLGGTDDDRDRPSNVGGLVVGIAMVVVWGLVLAEVLRRAARRRAAADAVPPVTNGATAAPGGAGEGDACSARPPP